MHVLFIVSFYPSRIRPHTGVFFQEQADALRRHGHRVGVLALPRIRETLATWKAHAPRLPALTEEGDADVPVLRMHYGWFPRVFPGVCAALIRRFGLPAYREYVARHGRPDVIHAHNVFYAGYLGILIKDQIGVPVVHTEHSTNFLRGRIFLSGQHRIVRQVLRRTDRSMAVGQALADYLNVRYARDKPVSIVQNVVNTAFFTPPDEPPPESPFVLASVGDLRERKGFDVLLLAFAAAFKGQDVQLHIGGDGLLYDKLVKQRDSLGLTEQVTFTGRLSREGVRDLFRSSHVVVSASRIETFGVTLIEALACGRPVVATRSGGPEGFITEEVGLLAPVDDEDALANALRTVYNTYGTYDRDGVRAYCENHFSEAAVTAALTEIYDGVRQPPA